MEAQSIPTLRRSIGMCLSSDITPSVMFSLLQLLSSIDSRFPASNSNLSSWGGRSLSKCQEDNDEGKWLELSSRLSPPCLPSFHLHHNCERSNYYQNGLLKLSLLYLGGRAIIGAFYFKIHTHIDHVVLASILLRWDCCLFDVSSMDMTIL